LIARQGRDQYVQAPKFCTMKNWIFSLLGSCLIFCPIDSQAQTSNTNGDGSSRAKQFKFIEGIEISREPLKQYVTQTDTQPVKKKESAATPHRELFVPIEKSNNIQFKYAQIMDCEVESITNLALYDFVEQWWQTRYRYGGNNQTGIDCSAFACQLMKEVYFIDLPRTSSEQYQQCARLNRASIAEGDMVFFGKRGRVNHVGVYLGDGYFVHASTNNGVIISNLNDTYYSTRYLGAGRISNSNKQDLTSTNDY
jgi:cell wall-associated NlpC family hydrolase